MRLRNADTDGHRQFARGGLRRLLLDGRTQPFGDDLHIEEIVLADDPGWEPVPEEPEQESQDEDLETAKSLTPGTWVEFRQGDGSTIRARLARISAVTGDYFFTDRRGLSVGDWTLTGLVGEFRRRGAQVVERVPLFDRAVSSLLDGMKKTA